MIGKISTALEIYRDKGLKRLIVATILYLIPDYLFVKYWNMQGGRTLTINNVSAKFHMSSVSELRAFEYIKESEKVLLEDIISELRPDDVFWDIGANIGTHTCLVAKKLSSGIVVPIEPYPPNISSLKKNLILNDLDAKVIEIALSNHSGFTRFSQPKEDTPGDQWPAILPNTLEIDSVRASSLVEVEVDTGDNLISKGIAPPPTIVKIDVEGASPLVIKGMEKALSSEKCRLLYVEIHLPTKEKKTRPSVEDFGFKPEEVLALIGDLGFSINIICERTADLQIKAIK